MAVCSLDGQTLTDLFLKLVNLYVIINILHYVIYVLRLNKYLQVLLHQPGQFPLVKELGFSVSPGFETSVSVRYNSVSTGNL